MSNQNNIINCLAQRKNVHAWEIVMNVVIITIIKDVYPTAKEKNILKKQEKYKD